MLIPFLQHIFLTIISFISNFLSALAGGGAGLIQLPALIVIGIPFSKALATHKLASVTLGIGASIRHYKERNLILRYSFIILIFGVPGVILGTKLVLLLPDKLASFGLSILILYLGIYSSRLKNSEEDKSHQLLTTLDLIKGGLVITLIGILNGSLTSGTGLFLTFWLVKWFHFSFTRAVAHTLILVGVAWNGTGAILLSLNNEVQWFWLPSLIIGSIAGGYIGAHYSIMKGDKIVKKSFEILTLVMGASLIIKILLV